MNFKFTPFSILSASAVIGLLATITYIYLATQQPWIGLKFIGGKEDGIVVTHASGPGEAIPTGSVLLNVTGNNKSINLSPIDLTIEPDGTLPTYRIYDEFLKRQGLIATILRSSKITFTDINGLKYTVTPEKSRPLGDFPVSFWTQLIVGLFAWLISSTVFAFRSTETSARYLLLSGAATLTFSPFASIYNTRELALPEMLFKVLSDGNFLGGSIFTASFVALLLYYPKHIAPKWAGHTVVMLFTIWFLLQQIDVFTSMTFARRFLVMLGVFSTFFLAGVQWFKTRRLPDARAALRWFLLSWMLGTCLFWFFILMPQMFGMDTSSIMGYSFSLFLLVYGGLAFGIMRYKLFALDQWWGSIILWAITVFMLVLFDLLFLFVLQLPRNMSISLALLASGLLWLPLRSILWSRFLQKPELNRNVLFEKIINIVLSPRNQDHDDLWKELLQAVFEPLQIKSTSNVTSSRIENDGLTLSIPGCGIIGDYSLEYANGGRKLFTLQDVNLADELATILKHTLESRSSYEKGIIEERNRISRDVHDNIGAQLMSALHNKSPETKDRMIRETLCDLRDIVNDASRKNLSFDEILADLRVETVERLSSSEIGHKWLIKDEGKAAVPQQIIHTLRSIIREAISNIIKHSKARSVTIKIKRTDEKISLEIEDDGIGMDVSGIYSGNGLANIRSRVTNANGTLEFISNDIGLKVLAEFSTGKEI
ncbi:MAG: hypothetical protein KDF58_04720 [Alphaproteobacteria bacterium]|nr:hypothetical protein [Alphaproteobacteria bacterium]HPF47541.1 ATP-binding protein [Emcibacteraceae bacterium]